MPIRIVGAGLPRTGTSSLCLALERLTGGACLHMRRIPGHPYELGAPWEAALAGQSLDWRADLPEAEAGVDWPFSTFWEPIAAAFPDAPVLLSLRADARTWRQSMEATILPLAVASRQPGWSRGDDLGRLLDRFARGEDWTDPDVLERRYDEHVAEVRHRAGDRLVAWHPEDGWPPLAEALGVPAPDEPFPHANRREDWS